MTSPGPMPVLDIGGDDRPRRRGLVRLGAVMLLLGLVGIAAASPLTPRGLVFNAILLALAGVGLLAQARHRADRASRAILLASALAYLTSGIALMIDPDGSTLPVEGCLGLSLLAIAVAQGYAGRLHRHLIGPRWSRVPGGVSFVLAVIALASTTTDAHWSLAFVVALELTNGGLSMLRLGLASMLPGPIGDPHRPDARASDPSATSPAARPARERPTTDGHARTNIDPIDRGDGSRPIHRRL